MTTTRTVAKEYDAEGRLVKETEVTVTTPDATWVVPYYPQAWAPQWWQYPITSTSTTVYPKWDSVTVTNGIAVA